MTKRLAQITRLVWASPNTAIGLLFALLGLPFGARLSRSEGAIHVADHPILRWLPPVAVTFGHCVLYRPGICPDDPVRRYDGKGWQRLGDHEHAHVRQYERWGPFFLPVYLASALWPGVHWMERQADRWAEGPSPLGKESPSVETKNA